MSTHRIISASLPSFCQKLSKLVEIWRSSDENNFAQFFETPCISQRIVRVSLICLPIIIYPLCEDISPTSSSTSHKNYRLVLETVFSNVCAKRTGTLALSIWIAAF